MRLTFTKQSGKWDDLLIEREGLPPESVACPKQGIIPHDMVHYAVESTLGAGFLNLLLMDGKPAGFATVGGEQEEAVERLVEVFQAEMWGGRVPAEDLLATYVHACGARGHGSVRVTREDVETIRQRLDHLTDRWAQVPVGGSLVLELPGRPSR